MEKNKQAVAKQIAAKLFCNYLGAFFDNFAYR